MKIEPLAYWTTVSVFPVLLLTFVLQLIVVLDFSFWAYRIIPADPSGWTVEERLELARITQLYVRDLTTPYGTTPVLSGLRLPEDPQRSLYSLRELIHLGDVKERLRQTKQLLSFSAMAWLLGLGLLRSNRQRLEAVHRAGTITLQLAAAVAAVAIVLWRPFFHLFHALFFPTGTWMFDPHSTLIRLFPEVYWFLFAMTLAGGVLLLAIWARAFCSMLLRVHHAELSMMPEQE